MRLFKLRLLVIYAIMACASPAFALMSYNVTVNTNSLATTNGYLYMQFNPGSASSQSASASIQNFYSNGQLAGSADTTNIVNGSAVTGTLPGVVTLANTNAINDYNHGIRFQNYISFTLALDGAAVTSPNNTAFTGSSFALSLFEDAAGTKPLVTSDGTLFTVNLGTKGTATVNTFDSQASVIPVSSPSPVPIPAAAWLLGSGLMSLVGLRRRMRSTGSVGIGQEKHE